MRRSVSLSACIVGIGCVLIGTVRADDKDRRKQDKAAQPAPSLAERVENWLRVLQSDREDDRRSRAATELGKLASPEHPEIVSALIDALVRDEDSSVRKAVVKALADIEPPTHEIKDALDQAVKQDKSWTVRQSARLAAWRYKPQDEPPTVPSARLRNTSKPNERGKLTANTKSKKKTQGEQTDPFKAMAAPLPVLPVVPAGDPPAPPLAPAPGGRSTEPARLTAPRPGGG